MAMLHRDAEGKWDPSIRLTLSIAAVALICGGLGVTQLEDIVEGARPVGLQVARVGVFFGFMAGVLHAVKH